MGANDAVIRVTVSIPKQRYLRMHAVTQANEAKHNTFINGAIEEKLVVEEKVLKYRERLTEHKRA